MTAPQPIGPRPEWKALADAVAERDAVNSLHSITIARQLQANDNVMDACTPDALRWLVRDAYIGYAAGSLGFVYASGRAPDAPTRRHTVNTETGTRCANCDEPASGYHGLAVDDSGEFVAVTALTMSGAVASCKECHDMHAAAGYRGPEVLNAYKVATTALRRALENARGTLHAIRGTAAKGYDALGGEE